MRIVMAGTGVFAEPTFEAVLEHYPGQVVGLFTQPDRETGQERGSTRQTGKGMKAIALAHGLSVFQPESINTPEGETLLRTLDPDLVVIAAYGQILRDFILAVPRQGCINVHASLLPKYRGAAPVNWAIYHGEMRTGVTIFRLSTGVDTGDILAQEAIDIGPEETAGDVEARLAVLGANLAVQVVGLFVAVTPPAGVPQDSSQATRAPKLTKAHGAIDWTRRADQVCCQVRAMHPWPTAYTHWLRDGEQPWRLIVHRARPRASASGERFAPGEVLVGNRDVLAVGAGDNTVVEVLDLQPAGKKRMNAAAFFNGWHVQPGDRLGHGEG